MNDSVSTDTILIRVTSWTSEKMGMKKEAQIDHRNLTNNKDAENYENGNNTYDKNNDKNKQYVKKMFESNNQLNPGNSTNYEIVYYKLNILKI